MRANFILRLWRSSSNYERALFLVFILSLPFLKAYVAGDGVGFYAYVRSPLIDHNFSFSSDWENPKKELQMLFLVDHFVENPITKTGHLPNYYPVGPAILWSPFLIISHLAVLASIHLGGHIPADGHSWPYMVAMAVATALYGFAGLCLSFAVVRRFVAERWAFWATLGIWIATPLPVFMYFIPSWPHTHSIFVNALFLWYWLRTRGTRTPRQWLLLGLLSGLMIEVHYPNVVFLLAPAYEMVAAYIDAWRKRSQDSHAFLESVKRHSLWAGGLLVALLPTFVTRQIVFGNPFSVGAYSLWNWKSPAFGLVLFSTEHGVLVFAPILVLSLVGLLYLCRSQPSLGAIFLSIIVAFYCVIAFYPWWSGVFGPGNRYFLSLTPLFILGLGCAFGFAERLWKTERAAALRLVPLTLVFVIWNLGLIYQWKTQLMPWYTKVYWEEILYNQFRVVPAQVFHDLSVKFCLRCNSLD
jgi:Dolichyl-phosphate-mannose-protein mannosyltransferase